MQSLVSDIHGKIHDIEVFCESFDINTHALIILGDVGFNYYLNKTDRKNKEKVQTLNCIVYCVRGNHEERPENLPSIREAYDEFVNGNVWYEEEYPNIRYLKDGGIYNFNGYSGLVIGGAYSVDKEYRLAMARARGVDVDTQWTGWFRDEQLTPQEMFDIESNVQNMTFDFVLSHTCPYTWQPFDLFLRGVDQHTVDNTMEMWLDNLKNEITWKYAWLFGHFHEDKVIRPHVEMFMNNYATLDAIAERWKDWDDGIRLPAGLNLSFSTYSGWNQENAKRTVKSAFDFL